VDARDQVSFFPSDGSHLVDAVAGTVRQDPNYR
jgi:hypothetical protein